MIILNKKITVQKSTALLMALFAAIWIVLTLSFYRVWFQEWDISLYKFLAITVLCGIVGYIVALVSSKYQWAHWFKSKMVLNYLKFESQKEFRLRDYLRYIGHFTKSDYGAVALYALYNLITLILLSAYAASIVAFFLLALILLASMALGLIASLLSAAILVIVFTAMMGLLSLAKVIRIEQLPKTAQRVFQKAEVSAEAKKANAALTILESTALQSGVFVKNNAIEKLGNQVFNAKVNVPLALSCVALVLLTTSILLYKGYDFAYSAENGLIQKTPSNPLGIPELQGADTDELGRNLLNLQALDESILETMNSDRQQLNDDAVEKIAYRWASNDAIFTYAKRFNLQAQQGLKNCEQYEKYFTETERKIQSQYSNYPLGRLRAHAFQETFCVNLKTENNSTAIGLMQWIRTNGVPEEFNLTVTNEIDERIIPEKAIAAAGEKLVREYKLWGDWYTASSAYHTGAGNLCKLFSFYLTETGTFKSTNCYNLSSITNAEVQAISRQVREHKISIFDVFFKHNRREHPNTKRYIALLASKEKNFAFQYPLMVLGAQLLLQVNEDDPEAVKVAFNAVHETKQKFNLSPNFSQWWLMYQKTHGTKATTIETVKQLLQTREWVSLPEKTKYWVVDPKMAAECSPGNRELLISGQKTTMGMLIMLAKAQFEKTGKPLLISSMARTTEYQLCLKAKGYPATLKHQMHTYGLAIDFPKNQLPGVDLQSVLKNFIQAGYISIANEAAADHVVPVENDTARAVFVKAYDEFKQ